MHLRKIRPWNPHQWFFESPNFLPVFRETFPFSSFQIPLLLDWYIPCRYIPQWFFFTNPTTKLSPKLCSQHRMICLIILLHLGPRWDRFSRCDSGRGFFIHKGILLDFHLRGSNASCIEWAGTALRGVSGSHQGFRQNQTNGLAIETVTFLGCFSNIWKPWTFEKGKWPPSRSKGDSQ